MARGKSRNKIKVVYKESSLPEEEKKKRLFGALDILLSEKDLLKCSGSKKRKLKNKIRD